MKVLHLRIQQNESEQKLIFTLDNLSREDANESESLIANTIELILKDILEKMGGKITETLGISKEQEQNK